jgi:hypothetical protein
MADGAIGPAIVLVTCSGGVPTCRTIGDVRVVLFDWDHLTNRGTQGELCRAWKQAWGLPAELRDEVLNALIPVVKRRCPISAMFQGEYWDNDYARPTGKPVQFDVTEKILRMVPADVDNLRDDDYPTDELADDLPQQEQHDGPFRVEVVEAAMEFLFADENEAQEQNDGRI